MKTSKRYWKKKHLFFIKEKCSICGIGFKIFRRTKNHKLYGTKILDYMYFEGDCIGGHEICIECVASTYGSDIACEEHDYLI